MKQHFQDGKTGTVVTFFLEDSDLKAMKERDKAGEPQYIQVKPPQPVLVEQIFISRILPNEVKEADKLEKSQKEDAARAERYRKLSPCCGHKMLHEDEDPDGIMTCTQCDTKYKNIAGTWFHADMEVDIEVIPKKEGENEYDKDIGGSAEAEDSEENE